MNVYIKIGLFILAELMLNRIVSLVFHLMAKKHNSVHLRFTKSIVKVFIVIVVLYSLAQQFEVTKDISKTLLQSSSLFIAIATFAAQQALSNVISGISVSLSKPYKDRKSTRLNSSHWS